MTLSRTGVTLAVIPAAVMLFLFWSLAIHMYAVLGGWPRSIGEGGFPPTLVLHADLAIGLFLLLVRIGMFAVPVAALVCTAVPALRRFIPYVGVYLTACLLAVGVMLLAPRPFLRWWLD